MDAKRSEANRETVGRPTPGPWAVRKVAHNGTMFVEGGKDSYAVAQVHLGAPDAIDGKGTGEANAHLIAAAPELLAALKRVRSQYVAFLQETSLVKDKFHARLLSDIEDVLEKAEGGSR